MQSMVIFSLKVIAIIIPPYLPLLFWTFLFEKFEEGSYLRRKIKVGNFQQFLSLLDHCVSLIDVEPVFCQRASEQAIKR